MTVAKKLRNESILKPKSTREFLTVASGPPRAVSGNLSHKFSPVCWSPDNSNFCLGLILSLPDPIKPLLTDLSQISESTDLGVAADGQGPAVRTEVRDRWLLILMSQISGETQL